MSLPKELSDRTMAALAEADDLRPVREEDLVGPVSPEPVGRLRVLRGVRLAKVVYVGLTVPPIGMDSHMLFAFTPPESAVPHFTLDAVEAGGSLAFHLDLVPRADLASHLEYLNAAFQPLTPAFEEAAALFGASRAAISPRQYAMMSPWMLVHRTDEERFRRVGGFVGAYLAHWRTLLDKGLPGDVADTLADTDLAARDARNRAALFSREVDPVWANVSRLLGGGRTDEIRAELVAPEVRGG
ncbi:hypothetical protein GCM10009678_68870 [Actinomadura kijaniata]|uniref:Uncharacterized protein n=1 Tax=Actinomadura namibiensis TaxID=182080 RepID=A0A7W3QRY6_ACTNM|nr:hypothetical protein [Actinomadura namibiensis]MBA8956848.1 hypothetical protein [Actinomadura namibiensis]